MATNARNPPPQPQSNGVITAPPKGPPGGNRKKQKRRAKQAARNVSEEAPMPVTAAGGHPAEVDYDEDPLRYDDEEYDEEYSDAEPQHYDDQYMPPQAASNGYAIPPPSKNRKKNKKKRASHHYSPDLLSSAMPSLPTPPPPSQHTSAAALRTMHKSVANHPNIWNTSTQQERQNIKDFWLSLSEDERKSLLKIEKEAVLRKMKQQQKHSCSCTVCGRKRTAIEEELEVLYEGYYEELEQYAHHDPLPTDGMLPEPLQHRRPPHPLAAPPPNPRHRSSQMLEHLDEEEEISEDEEYSDEEEDEDEDDEEDEEEDYSDDEPEPPRGPVPDFFNFGQNLTVKDNLLTVADDLLKNDGRKFIEMMEQLAERRMQRESEAEYAAANPSHPNTYPPNDPAYAHEDPLAAGDEYDDEEASYDSNEEYDDDLEEEDEMGGLTEEQRMQEGRRMFQIFAARMFEQRVLTAYKERVAKERQEQLLNELAEDKRQTELREAKKKRDAEKKKEKKRIQNLAKAEEKGKKEAEKAAEEARLKAIEEKKQEEARRKREEQRKKKEEERRKQEDEKARKEAEKQRRHLEEQQRREEAERKAREQRAAEKAKKEEARKREREERETREKEAKERKAQEEKDRKERDAKSKADREARERERSARQAHPPQIAKRPSQAGMVAVPGVHPKQTPSGVASPHIAVATPAVPKAPTPARQKQNSQHGSHASSPMQSQSQVSSAPSKSSSPGSSVSQQHPSNGTRFSMQKGPTQQGPHPPHQVGSPLHQQVQPPPGMQHMQQHHQGGFGGMPPLGFQAFQGPQGPMMHNMGQRGPMPMYGHQGPPMGMQNRMSPFGPPGMNGMNGMNGPPGMMHPHGRGIGYPFDQPGVGAPPGFGPQIPHQQSNQASPLGPPMSNGVPGTDVPRPSIPAHSRQQSSDKFNMGAGQPIARPAPIQRPGSMQQSPGGEGNISPRGEAEAPSKHLGSSALLDDSDEPMPQNENRRMSHNVLPTSTRSQSLGIGGLFPPPGGFGTPATTWATPALPLGQSPGLGQQQWGSLPNASHMTGWANNNNAFAANGAFGPMGVGAQLPMQMHRPSGLGGQSRPLTIRLAICQACKQLAANNPSSDGFYDLNAILRQMPALHPPPSHPELEAICETEGDSQNGGGELNARKSASGGEVVAVKWTPDNGTPKDQGRGSHAGLGEIGSPMPSRTTPAGIGFERPGGFPNLGAVGSPGF